MVLLVDWYDVTVSALSSEPLEDVRETLSILSFVDFFSKESTFLFQDQNEIIKV